MSGIQSYNLSPFDVANWFICHIDREAGDSITPLKLQKLMYYAQAWAVTLNNTSLFDDEFEAWAHGPVLPEIYRYYKEVGYNSIEPCECEYNMPQAAEEVMCEVKRVYGEKSAKSLENLTHEESPWIDARGGIAPEAYCNTVISKESMKEYYSSLLASA